MTDADVLAPLDWHTISCQCDRKHATTGDCPNPATRRVEIHALGDCNRPDLNPFGNHVMLLCDACLAAEKRATAHKLDRLARYGIPICTSCGAPRAAVTDVIREDQPL